MDDARFDSLTPGERAVLRKAATGATSKEIALEVGLSPQTVDTYLKNACRKLEIRGRRAAGLALAEHEEGVSQNLGYQSEAVANARDFNDLNRQAIDALDDRDTGGSQLLREERAQFGVPTSPKKAWWHLDQWGTDLDLRPRQIMNSILVIALFVLVAMFGIIASAESIQRTMLSMDQART